MDINADVGEGYGPWRMGDDARLIPLVTSANVACGGHAGDSATMWQAVALAKAAGVTVGAHVSYPDLRGFGRRPYNGPVREMVPELIAQIGALKAISQAQGVEVAYVKPHGSLYHAVSFEPEWQATMLEVLQAFGPLALMLAANCPGIDWFRNQGVAVIAEGYLDRTYQPDGRLVPRTANHAVHHDVGQVVAQALSLALGGTVTSVEGTVITVTAHSVCVHGDTPQALNMVAAVRQAWSQAGVAIRAWNRD